MISDPKRIAAKEKIASEKKRSTNVRSSFVTETDKSEKDRDATINEVVKALQLCFMLEEDCLRLF